MPMSCAITKKCVFSTVFSCCNAISLNGQHVIVCVVFVVDLEEKKLGMSAMRVLDHRCQFACLSDCVCGSENDADNF